MNMPTSNKLLVIPKSQGSATTDVTIADQRLKSTIEWNMLKKVCQSGDFDDVPDEINTDYALSFIAQTATLASYPDSFLPTFVRVI